MKTDHYTRAHITQTMTYSTSLTPDGIVAAAAILLVRRHLPTLWRGAPHIPGRTMGGLGTIGVEDW
jgi:hypothetical protein